MAVAAARVRHPRASSATTPAAATLHGALTAIGAAFSLPFEASDAERIDVLVDDLRDALRPAHFATAVRRGASMSDSEIVDFVQARDPRA